MTTNYVCIFDTIQCHERNDLLIIRAQLVILKSNCVWDEQVKQVKCVRAINKQETIDTEISLIIEKCCEDQSTLTPLSLIRKIYSDYLAVSLKHYNITEH